MRELRFIPAKELRVATTADGKRTMTGYAAVFDSLSEDLGGFKEKLQRGAFSRSLRSNPDVMALSEHDSRKGILGRTPNTLRLSEDNIGLRFECDLPATTLGSDIATSIERGDLRACSFGFVAQDQDWGQSSGETIRTLKDVDLFDVSVVANPAYPATSVQMRSLMFPDGSVAIPEFRAEAKEKTVDGEVLHADDFLIAPDKADPETWKLPVKFSTEEKTKSHLRDALARFDQLEGVSADEKKEVYAKLVKLAKEHGIEVSDDDKRSLETKETDELVAAFLERRLRLV
jgi:uncharacterized protein